MKRPSVIQTATKAAMLLRVRACSITGSVFSGDIHIMHLEQCCWKWHTSLRGRGTSSFILRLLLRVGFSDQRSSFSQTESELVEQALGLSLADFNLVALF